MDTTTVEVTLSESTAVSIVEDDATALTYTDADATVLELGEAGQPGVDGTDGTDGVDGVGVPVGGTDGQVLAKASVADFDTEWVDQTGGGGAVDSVNGQTGVVALDAGDIPFTPAGTIAATDVQAAIVEVAAEAGSTLDIPSLAEITDLLADDNYLVDRSGDKRISGANLGAGVGPFLTQLGDLGQIGPSAWGTSIIQPTTGDVDDGFTFIDWSVGHQVSSGVGIGTGKLVPYTYVDGDDAQSEGGIVLWIEDDYGLYIHARHCTSTWSQRYMTFQINSFLNQTEGDPFTVYLRQEAGDPVHAFYIRPNGRPYLYAPDSVIHMDLSPAGGGFTYRWNDTPKTFTTTIKGVDGLLYAADMPTALTTGTVPVLATTADVAALSSTYQPIDSDLTAIAALTTTSYGRAFLALADAAAGRTALGLGTAATQATGAFDAAGAAAAAQAASQPLDSDLTAIAALTTTSFGRSLLAAADAAALRVLAGAVIGTDVEAHDADLTTIAGLTPTNDDVLQRKAGAWVNRTIAQLATDLGLASSYQPLDSDLTAIAALTTTSYGRAFLALADAAAGRTALGLGTAATTASSAYDAAGAAAAVVSDTAYDATTWDAVTGIAPSKNAVRDKLETIATALALLAPLASPTFTGDPKAPTPSAGDNDTSIATTAYVQTELLGFSIFGTGSDGAINFNGVLANAGFSALAGSVYTLSRDIHATSISISSGVTIATNGFSIYCTGTITGAGATSLIAHSGANGGGGTNNSNNGAGATTSGSSTINGRGSTTALALGGISGATGTPAAGVTGTAQGIGGRGGAGGNGSSGTGGASGTVNTPASSVRSTTYFNVLMATAISVGNANPSFSGFQGGTGGGGGGGDATNPGGGGGGGGGIVHVIARKFAGTGSIQARGGNGSKPTSGNTGGGGGGGGGAVLLISQSAVAGAISGWTVDANGGAAGALTGTGLVGSAGAAGTTILLTA